MANESDPSRHFDQPQGAARDAEAALPYFVPPGGPASGGSAADVLTRHEASLLAMDGVVGVGVGATTGGGMGIRVYVRDAAAGARLPRTLDDVLVEPVITGSIDAYGTLP